MYNFARSNEKFKFDEYIKLHMIKQTDTGSVTQKKLDLFEKYKPVTTRRFILFKTHLKNDMYVAFRFKYNKEIIGAIKKLPIETERKWVGDFWVVLYIFKDDIAEVLRKYDYEAFYIIKNAKKAMWKERLDVSYYETYNASYTIAVKCLKNNVLEEILLSCDAVYDYRVDCYDLPLKNVKKYNELVEKKFDESMKIEQSLIEKVR